MSASSGQSLISSLFNDGYLIVSDTYSWHMIRSVFAKEMLITLEGSPLPEPNPEESDPWRGALGAFGSSIMTWKRKSTYTFLSCRVSFSPKAESQTSCPASEPPSSCIASLPLPIPGREVVKT